MDGGAKLTPTFAAPPGGWHTISPAEVAAHLASGPGGLALNEAERRLARYGRNELAAIRARGDLAILADQARSPFTAVLAAAALLSGALGDVIDAVAIGLAIAVDVVVGFLQERQGERSLLAVRRLAAHRARVVRQGTEEMVDARDLVPGDLVLLESGVRAPADIRLVASRLLAVDESLLTGESGAVQKRASALHANVALADRVNMVYAGTTVMTGRGRGHVVATGTATELGTIVEEIRGAAERETPLRHRTRSLAMTLGVLSGAFAAAVAIVGLLQGRQVADTLLIAVTVAVAAIPEGLPVGLTIVLAVGARRVAHENALVRRLSAVEALGATTVIAADKTGTLTENRMTVVALWTAHGATTMERLTTEGARPLATAQASPLRLLAVASVLANEASFRVRDGAGEAVGDPTDAALLRAAFDLGLDVAETRNAYREVTAIPFEPERRYAASVREHDAEQLVFVKGAPERVLSFATHLLARTGPVALDRDDALRAAAEMARAGLRVLGMAYGRLARPIADHEAPPEPTALVFLGLEGMRDPPRRGVADAIAGCRRAGMDVFMVTGDHVETAQAIGEEVGIAASGEPARTGADLDEWDDDELAQRVFETRVYARTSPEHKLRIVRALQARDEVVAITGDGVNDAPALKAADVGVAMGRSGTDVAREAADMILTDDNFVSIFGAVREGRISFQNLRNLAFFLISSNVAEILAVLVAALLGWPLLLIPAQILWLNLVTEGLQDVALAFEPGEPDVVDRPPRARGEGIMSRLLWERAALAGAVMTIGTLALFRWELDHGAPLRDAQSIALTALVLFQTLHVGNSRSESRSIFRKSILANPFLLLSTAAAFALHLVALYTTAGQTLLRAAPIPLDAWPRMIIVSLTVVLVVEAHKIVRRRPDRAIARDARS